MGNPDASDQQDEILGHRVGIRRPDDRKLRQCFMCTNCSALILMPVNPITHSGYDFHCPVCMEKQWFAPVAPEGVLFRVLT
jgi:hypothetical protein